MAELIVTLNEEHVRLAIAEAVARIQVDIAADLTAAERRGYERAVANLRDHNAFLAWLHDDPPRQTMSQSALAAAYLEATKETTRDSDAYRAGQNTPASPPESTEGDEQAEPAVASTNTAQAQRGVQGGVEPAEYRDPDGHYPGHNEAGRDPGTMVCNKCAGNIWTGDDGWACSCDGAMFEYAKPLTVTLDNSDATFTVTEPLTPVTFAPADPPGLDAAIEAVKAATKRPNVPRTHEDFARIALRAAAPALRAGALRDAAKITNCLDDSELLTDMADEIERANREVSS